MRRIGDVNSGVFLARRRPAGQDPIGAETARVSSAPPIEADAPNVVWAIDFQFDPATDGKAIQIASMIDEHTREPLMNIVERSIAAERLVTELETAFTLAGGPPKVLRMDNGPKLISHALQQFCENKPAWSTFRSAARGSTAISNRSTTEYAKQCLSPDEAQATNAKQTTSEPDNHFGVTFGCLYATRRELPAFCARSRRISSGSRGTSIPR
jgi:transposase InsO family protein